MAVGIVQHRRRPTGAAGAPATMAPGEIAVNEVDNTLYYGEGTASGNPALAANIIAVGGDAKQNTHVNLTAFSGLAGVADRFPYFTGAGALSLATITAFARTLLAGADAATVLSLLGGAPLVNPTFTGNTLAFNPTTGNAAIELGGTRGTATTPFLDAHSGATAVDYDFRTIFSGGNGSNGGGTAQMLGALLNLTALGQVTVPTPTANAGAATKLYADTVAGRMTSVANIAALKALDKTQKTSAFVLGYLAALDGGGGQYYYDSADTTTADNGGTVIVATDGGRWKLNHDGRVTIAQFGALTSRTDNASYIQAAITAMGALGGGEVFVPSGTFNIASAINNTATGVFLRGASRFSSLLRQTTANASIINNSGSFFRFTDLSTIYANTPTGGVAIYSSGASSHFDNFLIRSCWYGMEFTGAGTGQKVTNFEILDYEQAGIYAHEVNDIFVFNFIMNAGSATRGRLGGIRLYNRVEAFVALSGDILYGVYPQTTDADNNAANARPAYNTFNSVFYDSGVNPVVMDKTVENEFIGCWFSGGRSGSGNPGIRLLACESTKFIGGRFFNNGSHGLSISANAKGTIVTAGWTSESNSVTAGDGTAHGIFLEQGATDVTISGGRAHNGLYTGKQGYGIFVSSGCSALHIEGNNLKGNLTGTIGGDLTGTDVTISGNPGCITSTRGQATVPSGQTVATVTHGLTFTPTLADIDITCGTAPGTAGISSWYITQITATTFQIVTNATATAAVNFGWRARLFGE